MLSDFESPTTIAPTSLVDYFTLETPSSTTLSAYCPATPADPFNPLLALRQDPAHYRTAFAMNATSNLLQLQTAAAHGRPSLQPLQPSTSPTSSTSSTSSTQSRSSTPQMLCCARCRRNSAGHSGMVQFGTNLYYCSHCASMVGYSAG